MAYQVWSVVADEQPTAAKWNILGTNDAAFNDGTGIGNATILPKHLKLTKGYTNLGSDTTFGASDVDMITAPAVTIDVTSSVIITVFANWQSDQANNAANFKIKEGSTDLKVVPTYIDSASQRKNIALQYKGTGVTAGSHTYKLTVIRTVGAGTCTVFSNSNILVEWYAE